MAGVEGQAYAAMQRMVRGTLPGRRGLKLVLEHNIAFIRDLCDEGVFRHSPAPSWRAARSPSCLQSATHRTFGH